MSRYAVCFSVFSLLLIQFNLQAQAEVYRWVDKVGNVHFGDRKPESAQDRENTQEISKDLSHNNIDSSHKDREQLSSIFAKESEQERQYDKKSKNSGRSSKNDLCERARYELNMYNRRMALVDKNGKDLKLSEKDRKQREQKARDNVAQYCH